MNRGVAQLVKPEGHVTGRDACSHLIVKGRSDAVDSINLHLVEANLFLKSPFLAVMKIGNYQTNVATAPAFSVAITDSSFRRRLKVLLLLLLFSTITTTFPSFVLKATFDKSLFAFV